MNSDLFTIKSESNMAQKQQKLCSKQQPNSLPSLTGEQAVITYLETPSKRRVAEFPH